MRPGGGALGTHTRPGSGLRWRPWLLTGLSLFLMGFFALAGYVFTHLADLNEVPCEEAARFAMPEVPERATEARCESYGVTDTSCRGTWRMPQAEVDAWLDSFFPDRLRPGDPGFRLGSHCGASLCVTVLREPLAAAPRGRRPSART